MSRWHKPFTVILVPHDGSETKSVSINWTALLVCSLFLTLCIGLSGALIYRYLLSSNHNSVRHSKYKQTLAQLHKQKEKNAKLQNTFDSLQKQLKETKQRQKSILRISGFSDFKLPSDRKGGASKGTDKKSLEKQAKNKLENQIEKNRQLTRIKKFVKGRRKILRKTPMLWPAEGWLSSPYGYRKDPMGGKGTSFHEGVDIAAWHGSPVRASAQGEVSYVGRKSGYGAMVKLSHGYGYKSVYAHLSEVSVETGEPVSKGEMIGRVGNSGHSTGSHVHYEVRVNGKPINPWPYLTQHYDTLKNHGKDSS